MAKKTDGQSMERGVHAASTSPAKRAVKRDESRAPQAAARPSALLDTRVIYCGDNLEQLAKLPDACRKPMQKEEGRMMKPALFPILHSSFHLLPLPHYHCDWHASHYVKVMLDQIFDGKNETAKDAKDAKSFLEIRACISRGSRSICLGAQGKSAVIRE